MKKNQLIGALLSQGSPALLATGTALEPVGDPQREGAPTGETVVARSAGVAPVVVAGSIYLATGGAAAQPADGPPPTSEEGLTELPATYGAPRVVLLEVGPRLVHAYWELAPGDCEAAMLRLGQEAASAVWVLRFYDVTYIDFNGGNAHSHFDVSINLSAGNWYVHLWSGQKSYCAEIGPCVPNGRFVPVRRSNFVYLPRAEPSSRYEPEWVRVQGAFETVERVPEPAPEEPPVQPASRPLQELDAGSRGGESALPREGDSIPPPVGRAGGDRGAESEQGRSDGHATAADTYGAGSIPPPVGRAGGDRGAEPEQGRGDGHATAADTYGAGSIPRPVGQAGGDRGAESERPWAEALISRRAVEPRGGGHAMQADTHGAASVLPPVGQSGGDRGAKSEQPEGAGSIPPRAAELGDGQTEVTNPRGAVSFRGPGLPQAFGDLPQLSKADMHQRYGGFLAGRPTTASQSENPTSGKAGPVPGAADFHIYIAGERWMSPSSESVSSFGSGGSWDASKPEVASAIDLTLNAEVVISGRAQPGQTVQVNGRWVKVSADGTFGLRLALPVVKEEE